MADVRRARVRSTCSKTGDQPVPVFVEAALVDKRHVRNLLLIFYAFRWFDKVAALLSTKAETAFKWLEKLDDNIVQAVLEPRHSWDAEMRLVLRVVYFHSKARYAVTSTLLIKKMGILRIGAAQSSYGQHACSGVPGEIQQI